MGRHARKVRAVRAARSGRRLKAFSSWRPSPDWVWLLGFFGGLVLGSLALWAGFLWWLGSGLK